MENGKWKMENGELVGFLENVRYNENEGKYSE
jgi:hypothetical protein